LFNATVFENIANGLVGTAWENDSDSDKLLRVKDAAKLAFAHDFIESLPQGYETRIGERGGLLSGGQKQRVAIARSIISQPKILLLDEATSALDPHAEEVVQKALDSVSKGRTTVVIAHKLATIRHADNIVVMSNGRIVEQGRHEDLVAKQGTYAGLVRAQDLAPSSDDASSDMEDSSEELKNHLSLAQSHTRGHTRDGEQAATLADREDHDLYDKSGLIYNIWKLLRSTPEIWGWFSFAFTLSIAGGEYCP
jgi:ATP-binding cassette subfamily B (MDR/TAP) protein 1